MPRSLNLRKADDMHVHLRQGELLDQILEQTIPQVERAVAMPNTQPSIDKAEDIKNYQKAILDGVAKANKRKGTDYQFKPLMTFKIGAGTPPASVRELKEAGAVAGKLYPQGVTTNSEEGIKDFSALYPVYEAMQQEDLVLCIHGENPESFCIDREKDFLPALKQIVDDFPKLRIVLEHVSTAAAIKLVEDLPINVSATITLHHMLLTLDDVVGNLLQPHFFCKPLPKRVSDKQAIINAATSGNPKFFLGSDSAPHTVSHKICDCGAAGIYSAPVLLPLLAQLFEEAQALAKIEPFISEFGALFYKLPFNQEKIELGKESWTVPGQIGDAVPFMAGKRISWKLVS